MNISTTLTQAELEAQTTYFCKIIGTKSITSTLLPYFIDHIRNVENSKKAPPQFESRMYGDDGQQTRHDPNEDE